MKSNIGKFVSRDVHDVEHQYFEVSMVNTSGDLQHAVLNETRNEVIVEDPQEWQVSIIKLEVPTHNIPIFVGQPLVGSSDVSKLDYKITLTIGSPVTDEETVNITVYNLFGAQAPPSPVQSDYRVKYWRYYAVYGYEEFLSRINVAIKAAYDALKLRNPGMTSTAQPFLIFDAVTGLISVTAQKAFDETDVGRMYFSDRLHEIMRMTVAIINLTDKTKYACLQLGYGGTVYGDMTKSNLITIAAPYPGNGTQGYINVQQYESLASWTDLMTIVVTSTLPINTEQLVGPITKSGSSVSRKIFTTFSPDPSDPRSVRSYALYIPPGEYRMMDFVSNEPIRNLNFQVYWQDNQFNLFELLVDPFDSVMMYVMFRKKKK